MAFSELFLDELVRRNDIVDVVSQYVHLTKKSGNNLFGLCPFHSEKTPSFSVNIERQIYHCFGCGAGGGVINFIREIENLTYVDAVHFLAKRAGLTVPDDTVSQEVRNRRARLLELNREAARFFYEALKSPGGEAAREYLARRSITPDFATRFGIGFAPDSWSALSDAMIKSGYSTRDLLDAGLIKKSAKTRGGFYDTFRNRLMFPVIDVRGNVVGFSGRLLGDGEPKYLNSSDTPVFKKSAHLFGLNLAKKTKLGTLLLVEGNIDVVKLHQAGFDGAVASLGTALAEEQVQLLSRYTKNVIIAYDGDAAGAKAAERALSLMEKSDRRVHVLRLKGAKDPDEFIEKFGRDAFANLLDNVENHIEYRITTLLGKHALETDEGRLGFLKEATQMLSNIPNAVEREIYAKRVAERAGVSSDAVLSEVKKAYNARRRANERRRQARERNVRAAVQPKSRDIRYKNEVSALAEEGVIRLLVLDCELFGVLEEYDFSESEFTSDYLRRIYDMIKLRYEAHAEITPSLIANALDGAEAAHFTQFMSKPESLSRADMAMRDYIKKIRAAKVVTQAAEDPEAALLRIVRDKSGCGGYENGT
jgi:DNA primase